MRYSMLVYMVKMCHTLSEAAEYMSTAPDGEPLDKLTGLEAAWDRSGKRETETADTSRRTFQA